MLPDPLLSMTLETPLHVLPTGSASLLSTEHPYSVHSSAVLDTHAVGKSASICVASSDFQNNSAELVELVATLPAEEDEPTAVQPCLSGKQRVKLKASQV